jgi:hypothetical protein
MSSNLSECHVMERLYREPLDDLRKINFCNAVMRAIDVLF